ncbi:MAG: hypothetical protein QOH42_2195 [Blastocatellia bacterium]|nr:hypothetical protein [Blastocatellia bacterium]
MRRTSMMLTLLLFFLPSASAGQQRQIPITVVASPDSETLRSGKPLLLRITISNGLPREIRFSTFSLTPNSWNGEATDITLLDIYREPRSMSLFYARPKIGDDAPRFIAGMSSHQIKPGQSLSILVDISKWQIVDGWKAGKYRITVRADNIDIDAYTRASVLSDPVEIEIN